MKPTLLLMAGATALTFSSCTTTEVHPTVEHTVYRTRTRTVTRPAYTPPSRIYDTPESTTVVRPED